MHGTAPAYLADSLRPTSEFVARRHLRSADAGNAAGAADSSRNSWRPRLIGGSGAGVEQSASTDTSVDDSPSRTTRWERRLRKSEIQYCSLLMP